VVLVSKLGDNTRCPGHFLHQPCFFNIVSQRFFTVDMQPLLHRPDSTASVRVIRSTNNDRIQAGMFHHLTPVTIAAGRGEILPGALQVPIIDITESNHVLPLDCHQVTITAIPHTDHAYIHFSHRYRIDQGRLERAASKNRGDEKSARVPEEPTAGDR
jgi:hypothetical protein